MFGPMTFFEPAGVGLSVRRVDQPALARAAFHRTEFRGEVRPNAEQRIHAHGMQLAIHARWIGPALGVEVQFTLPRHVQEVDDQRRRAGAVCRDSLWRLPGSVLAWDRWPCSGCSHSARGNRCVVPVS